MPKMLSRSALWLCAMLACCLSGCLLVHHRTRVVREKETIQPLTFESPDAQFAFESGVNDLRAQHESYQADVTAVPFLFWISHVDNLSDNAFYNDQESVCDTNGDHLVTVQEASAYRAKVTEKLCQMEKAKGNKPQTANSETNASPADSRAADSRAIDIRGGTAITPPPGLFH